MNQKLTENSPYYDWLNWNISVVLHNSQSGITCALVNVTQNIVNKNTFCWTRYLSNCCSLYCCRDINPQMFRVSTLTFQDHMSREHSSDDSTDTMRFSIRVLLTQTPYLGPLPRYLASNMFASRLWPWKLRDIIGHVAARFAIFHFLEVLYWNWHKFDVRIFSHFTAISI